MSKTFFKAIFFLIFFLGVLFYIDLILVGFHWFIIKN
jgi:hypothetical protein